MKITVYDLPCEDAATLQKTCPQLAEYFKMREALFGVKWDFDGYANWPTVHDKVPGAKFLVFSEENSAGEEVIFGGRRIVPAPRKESGDPDIGILPFEKKYHIKDHPDRFETLLGKEFFDATHVLPGILRENISYGEIGGFAVDTDLTKSLFKNKEEYVRARECIYEESLLVAKEMGLDFVILVAQANNLKKQEDWLRDGAREHRTLYGNTSLYDAVMRGDRPFIVNVSDKYSLKEMLRPNVRENTSPPPEGMEVVDETISAALVGVTTRARHVRGSGATAAGTYAR